MQSTGKCICNEFTEGFNCDTCKIGYYGIANASLTSALNLDDEENLYCKKCDCFARGTSPDSLVNDTFVCNRVSGQSTCKNNRIGLRCESCALGFFDLNLNNVDCAACTCDQAGSIPGSNCDSITGECVCRVSNGIGGTRCDQCLPEFFNFTRATGSCTPCDCNIAGSLDSTCNSRTGQCYCKQFVTGTKCNTCVAGTSNLNINNPFGCSKCK